MCMYVYHTLYNIHMNNPSHIYKYTNTQNTHNTHHPSPFPLLFFFSTYTIREQGKITSNVIYFYLFASFLNCPSMPFFRTCYFDVFPIHILRQVMLSQVQKCHERLGLVSALQQGQEKQKKMQLNRLGPFFLGVKDFVGLSNLCSIFMPNRRNFF